MRYKSQIFDERLTLVRTIRIIENEIAKVSKSVSFEREAKQTYLGFVATMSEARLQTAIHVNWKTYERRESKL